MFLSASCAGGVVGGTTGEDDDVAREVLVSPGPLSGNVGDHMGLSSLPYALVNNSRVAALSVIQTSLWIPSGLVAFPFRYHLSRPWCPKLPNMKEPGSGETKDLSWFTSAIVRSLLINGVSGTSNGS